jgi:Flp pilus assembly pilin Flp
MIQFSVVAARLKRFAKRTAEEDGQALVEYALLISLVALAAFVAVQLFGIGVSQMYSKINHVIP